MASTAQQAVRPAPNHDDYQSLQGVSQELERLSAEDRVSWGLERFCGRIVLSSSFGAQSAVSLHLVTSQRPDIPVVLVDTGYLFPETYRFIDTLTERLRLNLQVFRPELSPAWQEARYGRLWEAGTQGIDRYNRINKVEPMRRALSDLGADAWFAGLRRQQAGSRATRSVVEQQNGRIKIHPIIDWTDRDVYQYLKGHGLPYHPLWHEGYVSIGDVHTTRRITADMSEEETRFFGLKRECGLHELV
ncbi:phosphoadenosine phosphosulfate reductase [Natronocella acetinitrilica]|uniref:Phosphoadenosine 5'-phosphosulfate reductase n=1 Tax=Natronocella acetinitrilica TaxID=414046 RepID=A0AAE3G8K6_9GAMM|nr:phosphoadenylyl-sulfate reductase [Natronocella acetinitrilica]MCP1677018.1 phosphoadenosine phosphosulfate reductase [Natronocella acetinitrilica]